MTKPEQFLWIVEITVLANVSIVTSQPEYADFFRHTVSAIGVSSIASEALWASERIPEHLTVSDAAKEFCSTCCRI